MDISTKRIASWTSSRVTQSASFNFATAEARRRMESNDRARKKFDEGCTSGKIFEESILSGKSNFLQNVSISEKCPKYIDFEIIPEVNSRLSLRSSTYALTINSVNDAGTVGF